MKHQLIDKLRNIEFVDPRYKELLSQTDVKRALLVQSLTSIAGQAWYVALVLLVLDEFHSPALAGTAMLISQVGILAMPFSGAILGRFGDKRISVIDLAISISCLVLVAGLAWQHHLTSTTLLALAFVSGLTTQIAMMAVRGSMTYSVEPQLLDTANALTFMTRAVGRFAGPLIAGAVSAILNPESAVFTSALISVGAVLILKQMAMDGQRHETLKEALVVVKESSQEMFSNKLVKRVTIFLFVAFIGWGVYFTAMPVMIKDDLHASSFLVGLGFAVFSITDMITGYFFGRVDTRNREMQLMVMVAVVGATGLMIMSSGNLITLFIGAILLGACETPIDQLLYGVRQRAARPEHVHMTMPVLVTVDFLAAAIGGAVGGYIAAYSAAVAFEAGAVVVILAALIPWLSRNVHRNIAPHVIAASTPER